MRIRQRHQSTRPSDEPIFSNPTGMDFEKRGLHIPPNFILNGMINSVDADKVIAAILAGATYNDVQDFMNFFGDRTIISGGGITATDPADGTVVIAACTAWCKEADSDTAVGRFFNFAGVADLELTDDNVNVIYLDYNAGTPQIVVATSYTTYSFYQDHILLGAVYRNGTDTHILQSDRIGIGGINRSHMHQVEHHGPHRASGMVTSDAGDRKLDITAGVMYAGLTRHTTNPFDTSDSDTFSYWYYDGDLGTPAWVEVTGSSQISNSQYNNIATGLENLTPNRYGVHWVYMDIDGVHFHVVYGQGDYTAAQAEVAEVPSMLPPMISGLYCFLIAKIICQEGASTLTITYPWSVVFRSAMASDHGSLAGLSDDDHTQYLSKSIVDAKGDIIAASGDDIPIRVPVGDNDKVLTADSTADGGVAWADPIPKATDWKGSFNWDTSEFTTVETDISALFSANLAEDTRRKYSVKLDLTAVAVDGSFTELYIAVKEKIDGTNYRAIDRKTVTKAGLAATAEPGIPIDIPATSENVQITIQMAVALASDRLIYYSVVKEHLE